MPRRPALNSRGGPHASLPLLLLALIGFPSLAKQDKETGRHGIFLQALITW